MRGLYIVTPDWDDTELLLESTEQALDAGAAMVQYRHKTAGWAQRVAQGAALLSLCRRYRRPLIINDHLSLCLTLGADGVHLGGADGALAHARAALGPGKIVGASCYGELALAREAERAGASYVALGGFYPSKVKQYSFRTEPDLVLEAKRALALPLVVIGGMTPANAQPLVARGADLVAAISSVYQASCVAAAVAGFDALFAAHTLAKRESGARV
ncbi:thiamine phosphate synthase [Massilia glaciei]|uniref:Thiamine-phosphate synthase n=1 Tax=Massilia glaciei TaxID=1524097 RepID=A0A2U2HPA5_9BURK|nr:thiamine phosphate synthase [Massilia glaciei]PWF49256.1 thiamine phosphate synthase [Massilia glaciei]